MENATPATAQKHKVKKQLSHNPILIIFAMQLALFSSHYTYNWFGSILLYSKAVCSPYHLHKE